MFSPSKLDRFKISKEELENLRRGFYLEALPMLEKLYKTTYWIILEKKISNNIINQVFSEGIEYCNVTKNQADWQSWIYRIWIREINEFYEKRENDIQTNFEFIDDAEIPSGENIEKQIKEKDLKKLLPNLPAVLRIPLIMKEAAQINYEKISELIDVPVGVIATRIYRARKLLFLLSNKSFDYTKEKQKWLNKESTKRIFELRKSTLKADDESIDGVKSDHNGTLVDNSKFEEEVLLQREIKDNLIQILSPQLTTDKLRSKIERKAKKKFK